jgi:hypothetical protein
MKNSIEVIWREGFLNEKTLVAPKINDLYNQKSKHVIEKMKRMFRLNLIIIGSLSITLPIGYYFLNAFWQGAAASLLLLLTGWYSIHLMRGIETLDPGVTSLDYLKSFDRWLKDVLSKSEKVVRFTYPLYFMIATSTIWSVWNKQQEHVVEVNQKPFPVVVLVIAGMITVLMFFFSDKIYQWDVRLMYGRIFGKLEETIAEMEKLKEE